MTKAAATAFKDAVDLFNQQNFFECHEVLEEQWRPLPPGEERLFLQGVLQIAVGFHHQQRENPTGARSLLQAGLEKLRINSPPDYAASYDWDELKRHAQYILNGLSNTKTTENTNILPHILSK